MRQDTSATYVIGHRNPDTDAICSAIAYADLLRRTRIQDAIAARCGNLTARTEWVLKMAGVDLPELVMDVRLNVGNICERQVAMAASHESFLDVYSRMMWGDYRCIPIVEGENQLKGILHLPDLLKLLLPVGESEERQRMVRTCLSNMVQALSATVVNEDAKMDTVTDFIVMVAASSEEVVKAKIEQFPPEQLIVLTGDRANIQELTARYGARCLVVTTGLDISEETLELAKETGTTILRTKNDTASSIHLIRGSRRIEEAVSTEFECFEKSDLINDLQTQIRSSNQGIFPVVKDKESRELVGIISRSDLFNLPSRRLVLVDHNEFSQAVHGAEDAQILEVIDHHRLSGNLISKEPIRFINLPVGSTCTIVGRLFWDQGLIPTRSIATCMCAGIVSDTLKLTSPTTTDEDRKLLEWLAKIAEVNIDQFAEDFFAAGSVLKTSTIPEALESDRKEYEESGYKVSISQIEELGLNHFWPAQESIQNELRALQEKKSFDITCVMVTDIGRHFSVLLMEAPDHVLDKVDYPRRDRGVYEMDGVVSRKKQLFPWISQLLAGVPKE